MDHTSKYAFEEEQKIIITNDSKQQLISHLKHPNNLTTRIVIAVPTYEMLDVVYEYVIHELGEHSDADVSQYITLGYILSKYSNVTTEYKDNVAQWDYEPQRDAAELKAFHESDEWENVYKKMLSDEIFPDSGGKRVRISVMLNKLMFIHSVVGELFDNNAQIVMFNPGINDYLDFCKTFEEVEGKWKIVVNERPDQKCLPSQCCRFRVTHITESKLIAGLIRTSYSRLGFDGVTTEHCELQVQETPDITLFSDQIIFKRFYGFFPILFETLNKSVWGGLGHCVGDGISSTNSFSRMNIATDMLIGPVLVKLGDPHPDLLQKVCKQLGDNEQTIKKLLIQHYAQSVINRVEAGSPLYIVCSPYTCVWLEELPAFTGIERLKTDKGALEDDEVDMVAEVFSNKFNEVANLSKSKYAFNRWVNANDIKGKKLHKLIAHVLYAVTNTISEGKDGMEPDPDFKFDKELAGGIVIRNKKAPRSRLIKLCGSMVKEHAAGQDCQHDVYEQYDKAVKGVNNWKKKYQQRKEKSGSHPLKASESDINNLKSKR